MDLGHLLIQNQRASAGTYISVFKVEPGDTKKESLGQVRVEQQYAEILGYDQEVIDYEPCVKLSPRSDNKEIIPYIPEIERVLTNYLSRKNMEARLTQIAQVLGIDLAQMDQDQSQAKNK